LNAFLKFQLVSKLPLLPPKRFRYSLKPEIRKLAGHPQSLAATILLYVAYWRFHVTANRKFGQPSLCLRVCQMQASLHELLVRAYSGLPKSLTLFFAVDKRLYGLQYRRVRRMLTDFSQTL
jgi:hypothetical protein